MKNNPKCPNCGTYETMKLKTLFFLIGALFTCGGVLLGFLILPLLIVPVGFSLIIASPFVNKHKYWCRQCKFKFEA